jgi:hypothetical protein
LMPGNHDRCRDLLGRTGSPEFNNTFKKYWRPSLGVTHRVIEDGDSCLAVVAADFCLATDDEASGINRLGRGKAHAETLDEMVSRTAAIRSKYGNVIAIWVAHFPPVPCKSSLQLIDGEHFQWLAAANGVAFIMAGHLHKKDVQLSTNGTPVICAGSMCVCEGYDNNWIHCIEVIAEGALVKEVRKSDFLWNDNVGDFADAPFLRIF